MHFAYIHILWLLTLIPILIVGYVLLTKRKQRQLASFGDSELVKELMPERSTTRSAIKFAILLFSLTLLIFAAARPQFGQNEQTIKRQGIEVMVALDISNSMLAEDVAPSRLDRAKQMLSKLIDKMQEDKIGLVVFAGEAYTQLPITCDYVSAKMFLSTITPSLIQTQGTAIGSAIHTAMRSFGSEQSEAGRAIILITDGENHEDDAIAAAQKAKADSVAACDSFAQMPGYVRTPERVRGIKSGVVDHRFYVAVGAFKSPENAQRLASKFDAEIYNPTVVFTGSGLNVVLVCPTDKVQDAFKAFMMVKQNPLCPKEAWVLVNDSNWNRK